MFHLRRKQELVVVKTDDFGVYLGEDQNAGMDKRVLLPKKQVPENCNIGDKVEVFLYKSRQEKSEKEKKFWQHSILIRAADWQLP